MEYAPFSVNQRAYMQAAKTAWLNVAEGGKRAGKNVMNILSWAICTSKRARPFSGSATVSIPRKATSILAFFKSLTFNE